LTSSFFVLPNIFLSTRKKDLASSSMFLFVFAGVKIGKIFGILMRLP